MRKKKSVEKIREKQIRGDVYNNGDIHRFVEMGTLILELWDI